MVSLPGQASLVVRVPWAYHLGGRSGPRPGCPKPTFAEGDERMVLTDESSAVSRLIVTWNSRADELHEWLATDPTNSAAWLWRIQLRICTYLVRRYGREQAGGARRGAGVMGSTAAPRPSGGGHVAQDALPPDARELRAQFRDRCHETLTRIQPLVGDARDRSVRLADAQIKRMIRRRRRLQRRWIRTSAVTWHQETCGACPYCGRRFASKLAIECDGCAYRR